MNPRHFIARFSSATSSFICCLLLFAQSLPAVENPPCGNPDPTKDPCPECDEDCPPNGSSPNPFRIDSGNAVRHITDLRIPAFNHGGAPLDFTRRSATRYNAGVGGSLGSGGSWLHNWQWVIHRGVPHQVTGHETLTIYYPSGEVRDFTKGSPSQPFMTSMSSVKERIEKDTTNTNLYRLWFPDGSHFRIERFTDGTNEWFLTTRKVDPHGLEYLLNYDARHRLTSVTDPGGNAMQLIYGNVGNLGHGNASFVYSGNLAATATKRPS